MRRLAAVQQKVPCVFLTEVKEEPSRKRHLQVLGLDASWERLRPTRTLTDLLCLYHFQVVATEKLNPRAEASHVHSSIATEKLDGTCCYVSSYQGRPWLWARLDRKPNKQADKRFKKFLQSHTSCKDFTWNIEEDFKSVPECWIPALGVQHQNGQPVPDDNGHIPGWVPVEKSSKQYCWHASAVNYDAGVALVLRPNTDNGDVLEIAAVPLSELLEQTLELIGTNINANPYGLGSKKRPVHLLVPHGALQIRNPPPVNYSQLLRWFHNCEEAEVEGIVWHCLNGTLVKLHRHHLGLNWPNGAPFLNTRPVVISLSLAVLDLDISSQDLFAAFSRLAGQSFDHIQDIQLGT